jgi:hypothetical protein
MIYKYYWTGPKSSLNLATSASGIQFDEILIMAAKNKWTFVTFLLIGIFMILEQGM